ncbi:MAG TPA: hypothetical protein VI894_02315 [Candidatus Nanoarchaeia archaeon]|nr:hypothetical protein [Candidatus Nanoarchaeia archaeon]
MTYQKKQAQATIFIVMGLVLLIALGLFVYLQGIPIAKKEFVPAEAEPVKKYVEDCISGVAKQGVLIAGAQSGYIEIPFDIEVDSNTHISFGGGVFKVPFWFIKGRNKIPPLKKTEGKNSIEEQLQDYIDANIRDCIGNLSVFERIFEIKELSNFSSDVAITKETVFVSADYRIQLKDKSNQKETRITKYSAEIPARLERVYSLAKDIMDSENENLFMENITLDLMALNPNIPFTDLRFECKPLEWKLSDIKNDVQTALETQIPRIRFRNTNYLPFIYPDEAYQKFKAYSMEDIINGKIPSEVPPEDAYEYFHYLITVSKYNYDDLHAAVKYSKEFGLNINARPNDNGILRSYYGEGVESYLKFLCINVYHFTYDVAYPVMITIYDDKSFSGEGFSFNFAFPVIINHNQGDRTTRGISAFEAPVPFTGYCQDLSEKKYDVRVLGTVGGFTNVEIKDVNVSFNCLKFRCSLGTVDYDPDCDCRRLVTGLPESCRGGFVGAEKAGYLGSEKQVADAEEETGNINLGIKRLKPFNINVVKHLSTGSSEQMSDFDIALIKAESRENDYTTYVQIEFNQAENITLIEDDATYSFEIMLIDSRNERLLGGYISDVTIPYLELADKNDVVFSVYEQIPHPSLTDVNEQYNLLNYLKTNEDYKKNLRPAFR